MRNVFWMELVLAGVVALGQARAGQAQSPARATSFVISAAGPVTMRIVPGSNTVSVAGLMV